MLGPGYAWMGQWELGGLELTGNKNETKNTREEEKARNIMSRTALVKIRKFRGQPGACQERKTHHHTESTEIER